MTNLQVTMLLHYAAIAEPYAMRHPEHANSPAVQTQRRQLVLWSMLEPDEKRPSGFKLTDRGLAFIEHILSLPLPKAVTEYRMEVA